MVEELKKEKVNLAVISKTSVKYALSLPERRERLLGVLGSPQKVEKFTATVINLLARNPKLENCTPVSFHNCLNKCADFNLFPDGRTATLIPYGKEATFNIMVQGYIELLGRNGILVTVTDWREGDMLEEVNGVVTHKRDLLSRANGESKKLLGYTVHAQMPDGKIKSEIIFLDYIEKCKSKSKNQDMWVNEKTEMEKKTCVRYIAKYLPLTSDISQAIAADDEANYDYSNQPKDPPRVDIAAMFGQKSEEVDPEAEINDAPAE